MESIKLEYLAIIKFMLKEGCNMTIVLGGTTYCIFAHPVTNSNSVSKLLV